VHGQTLTKGRGFKQPLQPHKHWHVDFPHLNIGGTFYYLCSALGCISPTDQLAQRHSAIFAARDKQLEPARENRKIKRQQKIKTRFAA
jgi:hypothetical protein